MTTDREANRLRDKCRKQAIQILALCASTPLHSTCVAAMQIDASRAALELANEAWWAAPTNDVLCDNTVIYAEAEAMIRCGEVVPTW